MGYLDALNLYQYALCNPIGLHDPLGLFWGEIGNFFVGVGEGLVDMGASAVKNSPAGRIVRGVGAVVNGEGLLEGARVASGIADVQEQVQQFQKDREQFGTDKAIALQIPVTRQLVNIIEGVKTGEDIYGNEMTARDYGRNAAPVAVYYGTVAYGAYKTFAKPKCPPRTVAPSKNVSTGRTAPANLKEKLAMEQVKADPAGKKLPIEMSDTQNNLLAKDGWVKKAQNVNGVEVHYAENTITGEVTDFKVKD